MTYIIYAWCWECSGKNNICIHMDIIEYWGKWANKNIIKFEKLHKGKNIN